MALRIGDTPEALEDGRLTELLASRAREIEVLSDLIARVSSSLELDEVLDRAIEVCAELTGCEGALIYLWDEEQKLLVVRGAVDGYRDFVGKFSLAMGEGLTGWTALNRQPGIIAENPLADPRYKLVPELNDEQFQSALTVPVVSRDDQLVGVITLHTRAPHEFTDDDVRRMETVASLVASAVENAKLHQQALRSVEVFRRLAELSSQMTAASSAGQNVQRLALTALELLDAAVAVVLRFDEGRGRLAVETWVGEQGTLLRTDGIPLDEVWTRLLNGAPASIAITNDDPLVRALGLRLRLRSLFAAPLSFNERPTGMLCCYACEQRSLSEDNLALLGTIANHAAIALEEERLGAKEQEQVRVRKLFDALQAGDSEAAVIGLARAASVELSDSHVVVMAEARDRGEDNGWAATLAAELGQAFPGTVSEARHGIHLSLVPVRSKTWSAHLESTLVHTLGRGARTSETDLAVGFSDITAEHYAQAFRQAEIACAVAAADPASRVRGYKALGAQRYLLTISQERDPDELELAVGKLVEIDRERGSQLFRTLETYLNCRGNSRQTSKTLFIHRNTLRQRLQRIEDVIGIDPKNPKLWFDLILSIRLHHFRASSRTLS